MMLLQIQQTSNPWNYKTTTTEIPKQTYLKFYRIMATDMLFIIRIQMWEVNERTTDKNEGGRNIFFFRAATGCRITEHKQNGNNKRIGDNT